MGPRKRPMVEKPMIPKARRKGGEIRTKVKNRMYQMPQNDEFFFYNFYF